MTTITTLPLLYGVHFCIKCDLFCGVIPLSVVVKSDICSCKNVQHFVLTLVRTHIVVDANVGLEFVISLIIIFFYLPAIFWVTVSQKSILMPFNCRAWQLVVVVFFWQKGLIDMFFCFFIKLNGGFWSFLILDRKWRCELFDWIFMNILYSNKTLKSTCISWLIQ